MLKKLLLALAFFLSATAFAAVDINRASEAELDSINGIGPGLSERILAERDKGEFKDWADLIERVKGIGEKTASKFSAAGLTVQGKRFSAAAWARAQAKHKEGSPSRRTAQPAEPAQPASPP
jgi:competence protein ComEA